MPISAPGKLVLLGEYAVLEGARALVCAVNRRAVGTTEAEGAQDSEVVAAVRAHAKSTGVEVSKPIRIDTSGFRAASGQKLGLGSSAAVAVVSSALLLDAGDERVLRLAVEAHRAASGGTGSGVDVAASYHGGVIALKKQPGPVMPLPSRLRGWELSVLFTGTSARTPDLVEACMGSRDSPRWLAVLSKLADEGIKAYQNQEGLRFCTVVAQSGRAMKSFGKSAGVSIVSEQIEVVMDLASDAGAVAKPSGAGGGDVVVLWSRDREAADRVAERSGCKLLDLDIDPCGLARR